MLNLESLESRRVKFDLILMYKIRNKLLDIDFNKFFIDRQSNLNYNLRGHRQKLTATKYTGTTIRQNFFSNRIVSIWNSLPGDTVNSKTLQIFKSQLNQIDLTKFYSAHFL